MEMVNAIEIAKGIYWVGAKDEKEGLNCNPYLLVDGDEGVLIDPGSVLDFEYVYENVTKIIPIEKIKYVVLHHQDPDLCSSVPLFEQMGAKFTIVTHWRTQTLVKYYGIKSDYYIVNENNFRLKLKSGRKLKFIQTPYLHFPGAIATYDTESKILFSSDLFGAFSYDWNLYAGKDYMEKMKAFHEHYMPSNDILRPVMEIFMAMDISLIAPQHGSIIKEDIKRYIKELRELECGTFMKSIKKSIAKSGGYAGICTFILKRYSSIFKPRELLEAIDGLDITLDKESMEIRDYNYTGDVLWNILFEIIMAKKGLKWLIVIEPLVQKLSNDYDIPMPSVFKSTIKNSEEETYRLSSENKRLKEINEHLKNSIAETQEKLIKCPVTGLYNYEFFKTYMETEMKDISTLNGDDNPSLIILSIDNMSKIMFNYGDAEVDDVLRSIVYILNEAKEDYMTLFRLQGESFACYIPHLSKDRAILFAEKIRNTIGLSKIFIEKITVSIGVVCMEELSGKSLLVNEPHKAMYEIAMMRLKLAKNKGMNTVCSSSSVENYQDEIGRILIIDTDDVNVDVLKTFLENLNYKVLTAKDGEEALDTAEKESLDLIISEIMIPKIDGFLVRERLTMQSHTKNIPFIIVSHLKNEDSVQRAANLNISHYFKKPFMLSELRGVVKNTVRGEANL